MSHQMTAEQATKQTVISILRDPKAKHELSLVLPKNMSVDKFTRLVLSEVVKNPKLNKCDPREFMLSVSTVAQLGLEVGASLGHAYILPYENKKKNKIEPQVIIGYRGMIDLARRSGQIVSIEARAVFEKDKFEVEFGLNSKLVHVPNFELENRGEIKFVYAVANLVGGGVQFEVLGLPQIQKAKPKYGSNIWDSNFEEMAKKTAIRRLFKMLPISTEMSRAISIDDAADADISQINIIDNECELVDEDTGEIQKISIKPIDKEQSENQKTENQKEDVVQKTITDDGWDEFQNGGEK